MRESMPRAIDFNHALYAKPSYYLHNIGIPYLYLL